MTEKNTIREEAKRVRASIQHAADDADRFYTQFEALNTSGIVSAYWPKRDEASPLAIIENLLQQGRTVCLPCLHDHKMDFVLYVGQELEKGAFGLMQPRLEQDKIVTPDVMIIPLLAFDRTGTRLGYGKGHYDQYMSLVEKPLLKVGMAYDAQLCLFPLPVEPHDVRLDIVITPTQVYKF
ncbi:MAG: 5-formyltetrahydrofolate cyclo-ligase [Alphaproteobacteria bacterium]|nr:5-formyltetrahydrofolate cyclo-ligase [Alphaproteobacteria bacterium]